MATATCSSRFFQFGRFSLDATADRLYEGERAVAVPPKAVALLKVLVTNRGRAVSKDELLQLVWPDTIVEEANLTQQIFTLRKLFGDDPADPIYISTVPRLGYRFVADVTEALDRPTRSPHAKAADHDQQLMPDGPAVGHSIRSHWRARWVGGPLAALAAASVGFALLARDPPVLVAPPVAFEVVLPAGHRVSPRDGLAGVSPDGLSFAAVVSREGTTMIWVRPMGRTEGEVLPGSERATQPFWSWDSRRLGFFADGHLRVISLAGGPPVDLAPALQPKGGAWLKDDTIVYSPDSRSALWRVSAHGGRARPLTTLDPVRRDVSHRWPSPLPDGARFIFLAWCGDSREQGVFAGSLDGTRPRRILSAQSPAKWLPGHLLYINRETLVAQPFDVEALEVTGEFAPVADSIGRGPNDDAAFAVSAAGAVSYISARYAQQLQLVDAAGRQLATLGETAQYGDPAVSPDGTRVAFAARHREQGNDNLDIWVQDLGTGTRIRLTFDEAVDVLPVWSPDGRQVLFRSNRSGSSDLYRKTLDSGPGAETLVVASEGRKDPTDWSPDGRSVLFNLFTPDGGVDVWQVFVDAPERAVPLVEGPGNQSNARFSPDGRFIAYATTESGSRDVIIESLADRKRWQAARGSDPHWSRDGKAVFFVGPTGDVQQVDVEHSAGSFKVHAPKPMFSLELFVNLRNGIAPAPGGRQFVLTIPYREPAKAPTVVLNWTHPQPQGLSPR